MASFPFDVVGFDLDGTLLDTSGDLAAAVNHALSADGRQALETRQIVPMVGGGARHMLAQALAATGACEEADVERLLPTLLDHYEHHIAIHTRPFVGAIEAVDTLRQRGVRCAVVTNKRERFTHKLLRELGIHRCFDCVIGGDTVARAKPAPDPVLAMIERCGGGRAAFVGDSIYDVRAARGAGVPVVACAFGFLQQPVETLGADAVIENFDELIQLLERLSST